MKRKVSFINLVIVLIFVYLSLFKIEVAVADKPVTPPPEIPLSSTPTNTATFTPTATPTSTNTPTITPTSTSTLTPTSTYNISKIYPVQDDNSDAQTQLENIQKAIANLQEYVETSQPDNSQIQDALNLIGDSLIAAQQDSETEKLKQSIVGWVQFAVGLILGAMLGWVNIQPPLPPIRRDLLAAKLHQLVQYIKKRLPEKSIDKKSKQRTDASKNKEPKAG